LSDSVSSMSTKHDEVIIKMTTIIKEVINEIWVFDDPNDQEEFSSFMCSNILATMDIRLLAETDDSKSSLLEIDLIPVEDVWEAVEEGEED